MDKAHVQHAVGFVQHQHFYAGQVHEALLLQVQQTAGCGHQNVYALVDAVDLGLHADAAKDHGRGDVQILGVGADVFFNLRSQFTGRSEDQGANATCWALCAALCEAVQDRQREGSGFACAGLRTGQQVFACQHSRNRLCLNGGWVFVTLFQHRFHNGGCQVQFFKCHCCRLRPSGRRVSAFRSNRGVLSQS